MRYLALTENDKKEMLKAVGASSVDALYDAVPAQFLLKKPIENLPNHQGEIEVEAILKSLAKKNRSAGEGPFFLGAGCYRHHIPAAVDHIIQRSEFLTSYTPYQPEIARNFARYFGGYFSISINNFAFNRHGSSKRLNV